MTKPHSTTSPPSLQTITEDNSTLKLKIKGALNAYTTSKIWTDSLTAIKTAKPSQLIVDGSEIDYCDTAGIAFFTNLQIRQEQLGGNFKVEGLSDEINKLYKLFDAEQLKEPDITDSIHTENKIEAV